MSMLELRQVSKVYGQGAAEVHALPSAAIPSSPIRPARTAWRTRSPRDTGA